MKRVWKYKLKAERGVQEISMPPNTDILKLNIQQGIPVMWGIHQVEYESNEWSCYFRVVFTGEQFPEEYDSYIGTFELEGLVYHVFKL